MISIKNKWLAIVVFILSFSANASTNNISLEDFAAKQNIIRVVMDSTPGFGDQSASINVMDRLRQFGFKGVFEIIYSKNIKDKLTTLFNLPKDIPHDYFD